jgi:hypothetical protein
MQVRSELNLRRDKGQEGEALLAWFNGLPEVQATLKDGFEGASVSKQNLSEWRLGGFREWQVRAEWKAQARELSDATGELGQILEASLLGYDLSVALAARYAALLNGWDGEPDPKFEAKSGPASRSGSWSRSTTRARSRSLRR